MQQQQQPIISMEEDEMSDQEVVSTDQLSTLCRQGSARNARAIWKVTSGELLTKQTTEENSLVIDDLSKIARLKCNKIHTFN
jgi:hypothetical protein